MPVFPDPLDCFYPSVLSWTKSALRQHPVEYLGDLIRIRTLVPGLHGVRDIYALFTSEVPDTEAERLSLLQQFRQQTFLALLQETQAEYRLDWSREDHSFCLWYRHRDRHRDPIRDLSFVQLTTLPLFPETEIRDSHIHGFGLFTRQPYPADVFLGGPLDGQVLTFEEYDPLRVHLSHHLGRLRHFFFTEWNVLSGQRFLVRPLRTSYSFINHSGQPNLGLIREANDVLRLRTLRPIPAQAEFTLDYRQEPLPHNYFENPQALYLRPAYCEGLPDSGFLV